MKRKKMMSLLLLIGFIPFLFGFRFGGEIKYDQPVRFQHDSTSNGNFNNYQKIAAGDVNGDGLIDLIMIRNVSKVTPSYHEVRIYKNKGGSNLQDMFAKGTHQGGQGDADADSVQIYVEKDEGLYTCIPHNTCPSGVDCASTGQKERRFFDDTSSTKASQNSKAPFYSMAVTYTTINSKKVVDSIYIARAYIHQQCEGYGHLLGSNYCNAAPYFYAGKILQLKNPYVINGGVNQDDAFKKWRRVEVDNLNPTVTIPVDPAITDTTGFGYNKETYIIGFASGGVLYANHDGWKTTYQTMAAADYKGDGTYQLFLAPWRVLPDSNGGGVTTSNMTGMIFIHDPNDPTNYPYRGFIKTDWFTSGAYIYGDGSPGGGKIISQYSHMQAVDMDMDGKQDFLVMQRDGSSVPIAWIPSNGKDKLFGPKSTSQYNLSNQSLPTPYSIWAANLRVKANLQNTPADNSKGVPDLLFTPMTELKVLVSFYADKQNKSPSKANYSEWTTIYDGTSQTNNALDAWMYNIRFNNVIAADVDGDGENEIIVTTDRTSQFWIFKKSTAKYLTQYIERKR